jgi:hypothetical protein
VNAVERSMAIVVPTKNERRKVIDGRSVGHPSRLPDRPGVCLRSEPIDRFEIETGSSNGSVIRRGTPAIAIHQDDPGLADALAHSGMADLVDGDRVRHGKG